MARPKKIDKIEVCCDIHEFYMAIINCLPNIIYWVDTECRLQGYNNAFVRLFGIKNLKDIQDTPYQIMKRFTHWEDKRVEQLKLDDMAVLFSGNAQYNKDEPLIRDNKGEISYFQSTRVPVYDRKKSLVGLIVTLTDVTDKKDHETERTTSSFVNTDTDMESNNDHIPFVLIIEDNFVAQNIEKALLTELHCNVDIAANADNALKLFDPGKYDLVLMDIGLENDTGYAVTKKLRQIEKNTNYHVPIIALTGYDADVVKIDCEEYSMEGAITKPLSSEQAKQLIKHYVYHMNASVPGLKHS